MATKTYAEKLKDPRWQKKRLTVLQRDKFTCQLCSDTETELHIHHHSYIKRKEPWEYVLANFITYCKHCHAAAESLKDKYQLIKCSKSFCENMNSYVLLILVKANGMPKVALASYDVDSIFIHAVIGTITVRDINELMKLFHNL